MNRTVVTEPTGGRGMNNESRPHPFSADRPITSSAQDRLNRVGFAHGLADSVLSWNGTDSLVIGLYGAWGSGKTSLINLILERLGTADPVPDMVRFNPWEWSGHEELAAAFFRELEVALKVRQTDVSSQLADRFERYATLLNAGGTLTGSVAPIVAAVSVIVAVSGGAAILIDQLNSSPAGAIIAAVGAVGVVASRISRVMQAVAAALRRPQPPTKSLANVKRDLEAALQAYDRNIFVVVDDLDRLTPPDAVRILQLVKANADLPKMVYLLAFDFEGLSRSVAAALYVDGADYVDKIVQVPVPVPKADKVALEGILFTALNEVLEPEAVQRRFVRERWTQLYLGGLNSPGINSFFSTPRRIFRFISAFQFDLSRQLDRGECNVDPVDFIGTEVLRIFEMGAYDTVAAEKAFLTGSSTGNGREQQRAKLAVDRILEGVPVGIRRSAVEHILRRLFPAAEWALTGSGQLFDRNRQLADRRVAHPDMFDFYFQMTVPSSGVSEGEIRQVIESAGQGKGPLVEYLRALMQRGVIRSFLRDVQAGVERIPEGQEAVFITALFDIGDELESQVERTAMLEPSDTLRSEFIIEDLLRRFPINQRLGLLERAIAAASGVALPANLIRLQLFSRRRDDGPVIEDEKGLRRLGEGLTARIANLAAEEDLLGSRHVVELMYAWLEFDKGDAVKGWAEEQAASPDRLLRLFHAFKGYGRSGGGHPLEDFIDVKAAIEKTEQWLASNELEPAIAAGLRTALTALRQFYSS